MKIKKSDLIAKFGCEGLAILNIYLYRINHNPITAITAFVLLGNAFLVWSRM